MGRVSWDMLDADDLIVADKEEARIQTRFTDWQRALESEGFKINDKTNHGLYKH